MVGPGRDLSKNCFEIDQASKKHDHGYLLRTQRSIRIDARACKSGKPALIMTKPFFLRAEHCIGNVSEAPASPPPKSWSSSPMSALKMGKSISKKNKGWLYKKMLVICQRLTHLLHISLVPKDPKKDTNKWTHTRARTPLKRARNFNRVLPLEVSVSWFWS